MRITLSQRTGRPTAMAVRTWAGFNALPADQRTVGVNVVGILPGTDSALRSQAVLVDAHYDHVGIGRAVNGDSIYNGADDDGSGTVAVDDPRPDQQFFQRSDNIAFARLGIVAHTWSSFNLHTDYHQPSDDVSKIDFDHMTRLIDAATRAVWVLANGDVPTWNPGGQRSGTESTVNGLR